jgi:adenylyl-sulfate kinase
VRFCTGLMPRQLAKSSVPGLLCSTFLHQSTRKALIKPHCSLRSFWQLRMPMLNPADPLTSSKSELHRSSNVTFQQGGVSRAKKEALLQQRACVLWLTGLSGSGKSSVALAVEHALADRGVVTTLLDGDNLRHGLCCDLNFSKSDREENIRRSSEVAKLFVESGVITLCCFISPYRSHREAARARLKPGDFVEVYVKVTALLLPSRKLENKSCLINIFGFEAHQRRLDFLGLDLRCRTIPPCLSLVILAMYFRRL